MNQRLTNLLTTLPDTLTKTDSNAAIQTAVVALEDAVLRSNLENYQNNAEGPFVSREYLVGEANTRGLSWKLNLLRLVAAANFCQLVRLGVHGGSTRVLGQEENLNTTFTVYDALVLCYEELSKKAFTDFTDQQEKGSEETTTHRVGWVNKFLQDAPTEVFAAVDSARASATDRKAEAMIAKKDEQMKELKATFAPVKAAAAPKAPKEKKAPKKSDAEIIAAQNAEAASGSAEQSDTPSIAE